jgi:hypothetical protein
MAKYYERPFAETGDKTAVTDDSVTTIVSYEKGYTPEYELDPDTNPDGLYIDRQRFNQIMFDATSNIKEWQEQTFPAFIADDGSGSPFSYPIGAIVNLAGVNYQAIVDGTTTTPPSAEFIVFNGSFYDNSTSGLTAETVQAAIDEVADDQTPQTQTVWNAGTSTTESLISPLKLDTKIKTLAIGEGQTWQNVTASRSRATIYTNTTGKPIMVTFYGTNDSIANNVYVDGVNIGSLDIDGQTGGGFSFIVPNGSTYHVDISTIVNWAELR